MTNQAARLANQHTVANSVCATCRGALVERHVAGRDMVSCATCGGTAFVSRREVAEATHAQLTAADDARTRQPWLARDRPTVKDAQNFLAAMWGKEAGGKE